MDENDDNIDDMNEQDYTIPGTPTVKNKGGNSNKGKLKKKKLNKINSIKLS